MNFYLPQVLGLHRDVVVDVASHLLAVGGHRGSDVVRIQSSEKMFKINKFELLYWKSLFFLFILESNLKLKMLGNLNKKQVRNCECL